MRPLRMCILNLMPKKIETETQILRLMSKSPLQLDIDFMRVSSHETKNTSADHLIKFYETRDALKDNYYDGFVITGAPVEHLEFEQVDYWDELKDIIDWAQTHVFSTVYLCWGSDGRPLLPLRHRKSTLSPVRFLAFLSSGYKTSTTS